MPIAGFIGRRIALLAVSLAAPLVVRQVVKMKKKNKDKPEVHYRKPRERRNRVDR